MNHVFFDVIKQPFEYESLSLKIVSECKHHVPVINEAFLINPCQGLDQKRSKKIK